MRHLTLTCKNHPELRWTCKSIAFSPGYGYNGQRHIFFQGKKGQEVAAAECPCAPTDLILAPEDPWGELSLEEQKLKISEDIGKL